MSGVTSGSMIRATSRARALLVAAGALVAHAASAQLAVRIVEPAPGRPLLGIVELAVEVTGGAPATVALYYDGAKVRTLEAPPWRFTIDVGEENVERTLRVVAQTAGGERAEAALHGSAIRIDEVLDLPLRQVYVTAEQRAERGSEPALGLGRGDFRILDDGDEQQVVTFERGGVPLAAVLVVDASLSMAGEPWRAALGGVAAFAGRLERLDEAMLLLFSDRVEIATPFASAGAEIASGAVSVRTEGGSAIHDHLYLALELLERRQGRRVAILVSDGIDIESFLSARQVAELAARGQATIFWIRVGNEPFGARYRSPWRDPDEHEAEVRALDELVRASGGRRLDIPDVEGAATALAEILTELRQQYVLGFYPTRARGDGAWHRVEVEATRPRVRLRTRDGYFDD